MPLQVFRFGAEQAALIPLFGSVGAASVPLAHGMGENHAYALHFAPGGVIGPHPAGFDQLFLVVQGAGWVAGADGVRQALATLEGAFVPAGEMHAKGSEAGMTAVMLQSSKFTGAADAGGAVEAAAPRPA